jgi:hypothetical protein
VAAIGGELRSTAIDVPEFLDIDKQQARCDIDKS